MYTIRDVIETRRPVTTGNLMYGCMKLARRLTRSKRIRIEGFNYVEGDTRLAYGQIKAFRRGKWKPCKSFVFAFDKHKTREPKQLWLFKR